MNLDEILCDHKQIILIAFVSFWVKAAPILVITEIQTRGTCLMLTLKIPGPQTGKEILSSATSSSNVFCRTLLSAGVWQGGGGVGNSQPKHWEHGELKKRKTFSWPQNFSDSSIHQYAP